MKKIIILFSIGLFVLGCNQKTDKQPEVIEKQETEPTKPEETEVWEPKPPTVTVNSETNIPSDAIVLFDGTDFSQWISSKDSTEVQWILNADKSMTVKDKEGDIQTKENFGSVQLHLEWKSSAEVRADGQNRSNSGVFLQNRYEVQILDNNDNETYVNGQVGSIYKQSIPLVKASSATGEWNTYDIIYHQPIFDENGQIKEKATITVLHNGVLVQDNFELEGTTEYIGWPKYNAHDEQPIKLQDHQDNSGVSYRNIWVRKL